MNFNSGQKASPMLASGFISIQDIGRERHCILKQDGFKVLQQWLEYYDTFWGSKLKKPEALLNDKTKNEKP